MPYLPSKPPKERKLNKLQLGSSEAISSTSSRKRKAVDKSSTEMGAESDENCVYSSETAKDDTKDGSITFLSQLYTGSIPDREITDCCGILRMPYQAGDYLMAGKGFDIQDLLDPIGVRLNIPPFLHMQDQIPAGNVLQTQQRKNTCREGY